MKKPLPLPKGARLVNHKGQHASTKQQSLRLEAGAVARMIVLSLVLFVPVCIIDPFWGFMTFVIVPSMYLVARLWERSVATVVIVLIAIAVIHFKAGLIVGALVFVGIGLFGKKDNAEKSIKSDVNSSGETLIDSQKGQSDRFCNVHNQINDTTGISPLSQFRKDVLGDDMQ